LLLEFRADPLLGLGRPLVHGFMTQLAQHFNQLLLDGIGRFDGTVRNGAKIRQG
jgi:hypothetical protein